MITVAHVSDTHFGGPPRASERAHAVMDHLLALDPGAQVVALLVDHCHTACATTFAGVPVLVGGATASVVPVAGEPLPTIWTDGPPSFALHRLDDDGRLTTHWRAL